MNYIVHEFQLLKVISSISLYQLHHTKYTRQVQSGSTCRSFWQSAAYFFAIIILMIYKLLGVSTMNVIETDRLILRHQTIDDASFILELLNDPSWLQYIGDRGV